jgi:hypothetical protein
VNSIGIFTHELDLMTIRKFTYEELEKQVKGLKEEPKGCK